MPVNYVIGADIIDIRVDTPGPEDVFLVDSNVWYWIAYTKASLVSQQSVLVRSQNYSAYINKAITAGAELCRCGLSLAELSHIIEKSEREIFKRISGSIGTKEYRHNHPAERSNVAKEVEAAWGQVKSMTSSLDLMINDSITSMALHRFQEESVDGYDLFFLEAMSNAKVVQIITDDGDFATVPQIQVFTANQNVVTAAQSQGKLITR